ncbi:hypothetical protein HK098_007713 [Nowakowskiella sp. JEL0407]|nr:hypothetical protein HK098_007713 [Nowakowskiella sp. JEL0407]
MAFDVATLPSAYNTALTHFHSSECERAKPLLEPFFSLFCDSAHNDLDSLSLFDLWDDETILSLLWLYAEINCKLNNFDTLQSLLTKIQQEFNDFYFISTPRQSDTDTELYKMQVGYTTRLLFYKSRVQLCTDTLPSTFFSELDESLSLISQLDPKSVPYFLFLKSFGILKSNGDRTHAVTVLETAKKFVRLYDPHLMKVAYSNLGIVYSKLNKSDSATFYFSAACKVDRVLEDDDYNRNTSQVIIFNSALHYLKTHNPQYAFHKFRKLILHPSSAATTTSNTFTSLIFTPPNVSEMVVWFAMGCCCLEFLRNVTTRNGNFNDDLIQSYNVGGVYLNVINIPLLSTSYHSSPLSPESHPLPNSESEILKPLQIGILSFRNFISLSQHYNPSTDPYTSQNGNMKSSKCGRVHESEKMKVVAYTLTAYFAVEAGHVEISVLHSGVGVKLCEEIFSRFREGGERDGGEGEEEEDMYFHLW